MATDPLLNTGGSKKDLQEVNEQLMLMKESLASVGAKFSTLLRDTEGLARAAQNGADEFLTVNDTAKKLVKTMQSVSYAVDHLQDQQDDLGKKLLKSTDYERQIDRLKAKQAKQQRLINELTAMNVDLTGEEAAEAQKVSNETQRLINLLEKKRKLSEANEKAIKGYMKTLGRMQKVPFLGSLIDAQLVQERMTKAAEEGQSKWKVLGTGIMATFEGIGKSLLNPFNILGAMVGILTEIVKMVLEYENKSFEIAKNLGVSVTHAEKLRNTFRGMAMSSANMGLSSSEIAESYGKMSEQMGFLAPTGRDFAETATKLEKRIGASAEQMSALASFGALSGKSLTQAYKTAVASATVGMARNKIALSEKQILDGISKVSSAVLINFKGNLGALAEAVVRAKKLGTTLDQVAKQGDSLLDFETSIGNEFEAQVLTGKDINLVKARELALMGDTKGLMEELNKQNMTFGEYSEMNIIQRQSFAQALGLSNEELSKQLLLQQQANQLGAVEGQSVSDKYQQLIKEGKTRAEIGRLIGDSAEAELNRSSRAEQLAKTMENLKETLAAMLQDTILPMVDKVMAWFKSSVNIEKVADVIKGIFQFIGKAIDDLPNILNKVATALKIIASLSIASAVANMVAGAAMTPGGFITGLAVGAGAYMYLDSLIPKFATGGIHEGGPMMVGEYGPEIVQAPEGSRIIPAQETANMLKGGGGDRNIYLTANLEVSGERLASTNITYTLRSHDAHLDNTTGQY